jgi:hypothetical protein
MAREIVRFARMGEAEWKQYSDRAFATVEGYSWDDAVDRFEAALFQTVELDRARQAR